MDHSPLTKVINESRAETERELARFFGTTITEVKNMLDGYLDTVKQNKHQFTMLAIYIFSYFSNRAPFHLLVNKAGNHFLLTQPTFTLQLHNPEFLEFFNSAHISISIDSIINGFLSKKLIKDEVKQRFFSEKEWNLFSLIRKEKPESVTIVETHGEKQFIKITKPIYASLEQRLSEIITKGDYGEILMKMQNGKIVSCKKIIKVKQ